MGSFRRRTNRDATTKTSISQFFGEVSVCKATAEAQEDELLLLARVPFVSEVEGAHRSSAAYKRTAQ